MKPQLPEYEAPPVVEVAVSLQFRALESLRSSHFGILWSALRSQGFSRTEDRGELDPTFEQFEIGPSGKVGIRVQTIDDAPPLPRVWFLNEKGTELVQVQRDRLVVNWRQGASEEPYPRYFSIIESFKQAISVFSVFVESENLGAIFPTQCETTYVNHIPAGLGWSNHGEIHQIVAAWNKQYSDRYLPSPEDVGFAARYRMADDSGTPLGRLHIVLQPAYRNTDRHPIYVLNITARGKPEPPTLASALQLFDREHEWIVRGFTSITTENMHKVWRRRNG